MKLEETIVVVVGALLPRGHGKSVFGIFLNNK
jgi:hypothetical protein